MIQNKQDEIKEKIERVTHLQLILEEEVRKIIKNNVIDDEVLERVTCLEDFIFEDEDTVLNVKPFYSIN